MLIVAVFVFQCGRNRIFDVYLHYGTISPKSDFNVNEYKLVILHFTYRHC
jgi:hypothetical protein